MKNREMLLNYKELYELGVSKLMAAGIEEAKQDAFYLLNFVTGFNKADFYLRSNETAECGAQERYLEFIKRRAAHEPCQYITGSAFFMGLEFNVSRNVLIPRQDTETLVEKAVEIINDLHGMDCADIRVLDMCTGSGCIAVSVKHFFEEAEVTAVDISKKALEISKQNAEKNGTEIEILESDMFAVLAGRKFDIILSNPPYVTEAEYETLMPEVKENEPASALKAGSDGLDFYKIIAGCAPAYLNDRGRLLLEIGYRQAEAVSKLLEENGFSDIEVIKDLAGLDRVVCAKMQQQ